MTLRKCGNAAVWQYGSVAVQQCGGAAVCPCGSVTLCGVASIEGALLNTKTLRLYAETDNEDATKIDEKQRRHCLASLYSSCFYSSEENEKIFNFPT